MSVTEGFPDLFSDRARQYAEGRPLYPPALFEELARRAPGRSLAWDCGTGNGQAAVGLSPFFDRVIATDASPDQLARAQAGGNITYRVARAERSGLEPASVDLAVAALTVHWFKPDAFHAELRRVMRPGGVFACWTYRR